MREHLPRSDPGSDPTAEEGYNLQVACEKRAVVSDHRCEICTTTGRVVSHFDSIQEAIWVETLIILSGASPPVSSSIRFRPVVTKMLCRSPACLHLAFSVLPCSIYPFAPPPSSPLVARSLTGGLAVRDGLHGNPNHGSAAWQVCPCCQSARQSSDHGELRRSTLIDMQQRLGELCFGRPCARLDGADYPM